MSDAALAAVVPGELLPPVEVVLTRQRLVMEAAANRDFSAIHFDRETARGTGAAEAYANTILLETLLEACVRTWAGPLPRIVELRFRMLDFNCVGDRITACGRVESADRDERAVALELWIESHRGRTVTGNALVAFP
jgi:acyl dehydratase